MSYTPCWSVYPTLQAIIGKHKPLDRLITTSDALSPDSQPVPTAIHGKLLLCTHDHSGNVANIENPSFTFKCSYGPLVAIRKLNLFCSPPLGFPLHVIWNTLKTSDISERPFPLLSRAYISLHALINILTRPTI